MAKDEEIPAIEHLMSQVLAALLRQEVLLVEFKDELTAQARRLTALTHAHGSVLQELEKMTRPQPPSTAELQTALELRRRVAAQSVMPGGINDMGVSQLSPSLQAQQKSHQQGMAEHFFLPRGGSFT